MHLASEDIIDAVIEPGALRSELINSYAIAGRKDRLFSDRRHGVPPV